MNEKLAVESRNSLNEEGPIPVRPSHHSTIKSRISTIDIAKGVGILLIVLGHHAGFGRYFPQFSDFLGGIRMPFFFFISGVTFSLGRRSLTDIAVMRADAWLKPFVVVVTLFGCLNILRGTGTFEGLILALTYGLVTHFHPAQFGFYRIYGCYMLPAALY